MLICLCHPASDRDIDAVIDDGARTVAEIGERCGAGTGCGSCLDELRQKLGQRGASCPRDAASDLVTISARPNER